MKPNTGRIRVVLPAGRQKLIAWASAVSDKGVRRFFSQADQRMIDPFNLYQYLGAELGVRTANDGVQSMAGFRYWGDMGQPARDWVLCADPVFLQPDRDQLLLSRTDFSDLDCAEAEALAEEINAVILLDDWRLEAVTGTRWYLHYPSSLAITTPSHPPQHGTVIGHGMVTGEQRKTLVQLINTVQMILHNSPVNQRRQSSGLLPINSVWVWGGDMLTSESTIISANDDRNCLSIWADDVIVRGMSLTAGVPFQLLEQWSADTVTNKACLLVLSVPDAEEDLSELLLQYLSPLLYKLQHNDLHDLQLMTLDGAVWYATKRHLRRWWRRKLR